MAVPVGRDALTRAHPASLPDMGELLLLRHGSTEWSVAGKHTGRTDIPLTADGEAEARAWSPDLSERAFACVLASPLQRAVRTAELAGLAVSALESDLQEWDYGPAEGRTTAEMRTVQPDWDVWRDVIGPPGETLAEVGARCDSVLARVAAPLRDGDVMLVAHGHLLRVLASRWIGLEPGAGALLGLDAGTLSVLGHERARPVLRRWALLPPAPGWPNPLGPG